MGRIVQYLGGKSRTRNQIAGYLNQIRKPGQPYWEPFVGAGWVLEKIKGQPIFASDANPYLIELWRAVQAGWTPPSVVTEEDYQRAKAGEMTIPETAFIGFGCSFGGKWFAGYARGNTSALMVSNSLLRKNGHLSPAHFFTADFTECPAPAYGCLIYSDPPYEDTTAYGAVPPFDSGKFWDRVRWLEAHGHTVVVSEYQAPDDFTCIMEMPTKTDMHTTNGKARRVERLFRLGEHLPVQAAMMPMFADLEG